MTVSQNDSLRPGIGTALNIKTRFVLGALVVMLLGGFMSVALSPLGTRELGIIGLTCAWTALCMAMGRKWSVRITCILFLAAGLFGFGVGIWTFITHERARNAVALFFFLPCSFALLGALFFGGKYFRKEPSYEHRTTVRDIIQALAAMVYRTVRMLMFNVLSFLASK